MKPSDIAWTVLVTQGFIYEGLSDDVLSNATQRYCQAHPILFRLLVFAVAGHLGGFLPWWADIFAGCNPVHRFLARHRKALLGVLQDSVIARRGH